MLHTLRTCTLTMLVAGTVVSFASSAGAQSAENVAVVVNDASPASRQIADYYVRKRGIPAGNVIHVQASTDEVIERPAYAATLETPIAAALIRDGLQDRVLYLVLTKGVPLRINGTPGLTGTTASVDSELALLYRRLTGVPVSVAGRIDNPYFQAARPIAEAKPFTHKDFDIYLVARLDAFTVPEVLALIDRGSAPVTTGKIVLDEQDKLVDRAGEIWLENAAARLTAAGEGERVVLEKTVQGARDVEGVLGYYSWGSNDPRNRVRRFGMGFVPGSLAATYVSSDARTFAEPPPTWVPSGDWTDRRGFFGGSPQTLVGDLIREGATGVAGHVEEPYLQSTIRPDILFPAYLSGKNLVESFYLAMPHLSWQTVVVGDPLAAPFRQSGATGADLDPGIDTRTGLPRWLSGRRMALIATQAPGIPESALALGLLSETYVRRGELEQARAALERATVEAPALVAAHFQLATMYEQAGRFDEAIARYRRVIELQPRNFAALNNLAFRLAITKKAPKEALPFAQQALPLAPQNPALLDTLAWIEHLLGDDVSAAKRMPLAVRGDPRNAEIRLHAAIIYAATGAIAVAVNELNEAVRIDPTLGDSPEVVSLRRRIEEAQKK